jgi:hypothetical protein
VSLTSPPTPPTGLTLTPLIVCDTKTKLSNLTGLTVISVENTGYPKNITLYRTFNDGSKLMFCGNGNNNAWFEIDQIELIDTSEYGSIWYDGHFYGGIFSGVWYGGTFHYGTRDGLTYSPPPKYKWVVSNIQTSKSSPPPAF